jgi:hypothetical protein
VGKRWVAVAVVVASACTALHYSTTSQQSVVLSTYSYTFPGPGSAPFTVSATSSSDSDYLQSVSMTCSSHWSLWLDPNDPFPVHICGSAGSGGSAISQDDGLNMCPHSYTFYANFQPTSPGQYSCNVTVVSMSAFGSGSSTQILMLTGSGSGSEGITVSPEKIDFGDVQINTQSSPYNYVVVTNNGSAALTVNGSLDNSAFAVTGNSNYTSFSLGSNASSSFSVTCTPPLVGAHAGTLTFTDTSGQYTGAVSLACNGINSTVNVAPTQITFDKTLVGSPPKEESVRITGGTVMTTIDTVTLDAAAIAAGVTFVNNPQGLPVGTGQDIVLAYSAAAMHAAGPLGSLSVKVSSDTTARNIAISGEALLGGVGTNPASIEFGAVCASSKVTKDVEVYASEAGDVMVQSLTPPAAPFEATAVDVLPKGLVGNHGGQSITVRASMVPTVAGDFTDAFTLTSNVPNAGTTEVQLHGIALSGGIAATPDLVHFGTTSIGTTSSIKQVQFSNCGTTDLAFTGVTLTGTDATDFTLIGANPPRAIKPTESELIMVVMQPKADGFKTAQLVIAHGAGNTTVDLDGTGEGGENKERETYYACSAGRGAGLWPIAFALLLLRRRRRA